MAQAPPARNIPPSDDQHALEDVEQNAGTSSAPPPPAVQTSNAPAKATTVEAAKPSATTTNPEESWFQANKWVILTLVLLTALALGLGLGLGLSGTNDSTEDDGTRNFVQSGPKIIGTPYDGEALQGDAVAISGDGNYALIGAPGDANDEGATYVFYRSNNNWVQQAKLVAPRAGGAQQGTSVSLSNDGLTALIGGDIYNGSRGAAVVFARLNGAWSPQAKLAGNDADGISRQGFSVCISYDGNTAAVGAPG
jgi:hypothetical protein